MDNARLFTLTCQNGIRIVNGATFNLYRLTDGCHYLAPKRGGGGLFVDARLLVSPYALVQQVVKQGKDGGIYSETEVTLTRAGLGRDQGGQYILVPPKEPEIGGMHTTDSSHALVWCPEAGLAPLIDESESYEAVFAMSGLVGIWWSRGLWMEWRDPKLKMSPPTSFKLEANGNLCASFRDHHDASSRITEVQPQRVVRGREPERNGVTIS